MSTFGKNAQWPGQKETPADPRNPRDSRACAKVIKVRGEVKLARSTVMGRSVGTSICGFPDPVVDCTNVVRVALENVTGQPVGNLTHKSSHHSGKSGGANVMGHQAP